MTFLLLKTSIGNFLGIKILNYLNLKTNRLILCHVFPFKVIEIKLFSNAGNQGHLANFKAFLLILILIQSQDRMQ